MRLCNDTITVFNARVDPDVGGDVWAPTVIHGCSWYATDAVTVDASRGGLVAADRVTVRIPGDADAGGKSWADPVTYANAADVSRLWTLKRGDIVVRGTALAAGDVAEGEAAPAVEAGVVPWTPSKLKKAFAECAVILAVTDNRRSPNGKHWRVAGA